MYIFPELFIVMILNTVFMKYKYFVWKINLYCPVRPYAGL
jgi:hypothetical protein